MTPPDLPLPAEAWRPRGMAARRRPSALRPGARRWRWLLLASLLLHAAVMAVLLLEAPETTQTPDLAPQSFEMMLEPGGPKGPPEATAPSQTPGPPLPSAPAEPPAPPAPILPPLPPMPAEIVPPPPPPPAPADLGTAEVRLPEPAAPRLLALPPPVPVPQPEPEPAPQATAPHPAAPAFPKPQDYSFDIGTSRNQRGSGAMMLAPGRSILDSPGAPPRNDSARNSTFRVRGAPLGKDYDALLHEWWDKHSYYPPEAARRGEDGQVKLHLKVDRNGHVQLVEVEDRSGSFWLDAGAQAVFRNAALPPLPPSTPEDSKDMDITIDYILIRR